MARTPVFGTAASFSITAATFALVTTGGTLPTPLYTVWEKEFGFDPEITTWIFSTYVLGTLIALIFFGALSDQIGRKPLVIAALFTAIASTVFFVFAANTPMLLIGRLLSGFSVGLITSPATAALVELYRGANKAFPAMVSTAVNMGGLGLGPLLAGLFAQYLPDPAQLVFVFYLVLVVVATVLAVFVPETIARRATTVDWTPRVGVPRSALGVYWRSALAVFPTFALLGVFASLSPQFIGGTLHIHNLLVGGLATFIVFEIGVVAQLAFRSRAPRWSILLGLILLVVALGFVLAGLLAASVGLFAAGTVVGGFGAGLAFMGGLGQLGRAVPVESRAKSIAAYFIAAQSGLAVPVLAIGALDEPLGLNPAASLVIVIIIALAVVAWIANLRRPATVTSH
ncbi:MFS transporter [Leifsonia sp. NPDC058230]|uniref:MFS transporter n=1 Tax=Leifsonia sp. NPDC058230 TaxID=3346391 RepID=UPI0036D87764